ncbi:MAG TPA: exonuclease SbcCD subunit D [Blastocatellia bacterium]|nr:exonuclease SbcCD subunit D [Blastocatellia bacterium]
MKDVVFYHCSDLHLGKTYADSPGADERSEDFFRVFAEIVQRAVREEIAALVIAGDLFHHAQVMPRTFARTVEVLEPLKRAGIPVIAVEGNHDWIHRRENISWMEALSAMGLICLLRPTRDDEGNYFFPPWDDEKRSGGHREVQGIHFYGVGYIGSSPGPHVPRIVEAVRRAGTDENVLLFHVGVRQYCGTDIGNMSLEEALPLGEVFRYVALGHGHKPYVIPAATPFAYNPGSPECVNFGEERYGPKGFNRVVWRHGKSPEVELIPTSPRPMINETISLTGCQNVEDAERRIREHLQSLDREQQDPRQPVVRVKLTGRVEFRPAELSRSRVIEAVRAVLAPLHVEVENALSFLSRSVAGLLEREQRSLSDLERDVVESLFAAQSAYQSDSRRYAKLALDLKRQLLEEKREEAPDLSELLDLLHRALHERDEPEISSMTALT